jgi:FkbM family methyltransferase
MKTPTAELPLMGWTEKVHPKFGELPPDYIARAALRRLTPRGRAIRRMTRHDAVPLSVMDKAIAEVGDKPGFTVMQVGAHDGDFDDPLQTHLNRYSWRAILVEPRRAPYARLAERYNDNPRVKVVNAAVSRTAGSMTLWSAQIEGPIYRFGEAIASVDPKQVKKEVVRNLGTRMLRKIKIVPEEVTVLTVADICDEIGVAPEEIDFFVSDTEGHDVHVVDSLLDVTDTPPTLLQYEHFHAPGEEVNELDARLLMSGRDLFRTHKDTFAIPEELIKAA